MSDNVVHITAEQLNANDDSITIVEILCTHGEFVRKGAHVLTIETSKAAAEIYSPADGYIAIVGKTGTAVAVGKTIASIYSNLDVLSANQPVISAEPQPRANEGPNLTGAPRATLKAGNLARELGINIADIPKDGFILEDDVRKYAAQATKGCSRSRAELSRVKKAAVQNLEISRDTIVPASLLAEFPLPSFAGRKVDVFDLVIHRAARLIEEKYPDCNAHLAGNMIVRPSNINFGFTVDVDGDIFMPVIRGVGSLSLDEITATRTELILALYRGERSQDALSDPTVCATGLNGRYLTFQMPVVYPLTSLIIGINQRIAATASQSTPVFLTLSYDHRVLSGFIVLHFVDDLIDAVLQGP